MDMASSAPIEINFNASIPWRLFASVWVSFCECFCCCCCLLEIYSFSLFPLVWMSGNWSWKLWDMFPANSQIRWILEWICCRSIASELRQNFVYVNELVDCLSKLLNDNAFVCHAHAECRTVHQIWFDMTGGRQWLCQHNSDIVRSSRKRSFVISHFYRQMTLLNRLAGGLEYRPSEIETLPSWQWPEPNSLFVWY